MSDELNKTPETSEEEHYDGILGDYEESPAEETPAEEAPVPEKPAGKKGGKKAAAIAGICAAVLAVGGLGTYGVLKFRENMPKTAAFTEHGRITDRMAACFLYDTVDMYKSYYGEEGLKSYFDLDLNLSLKAQSYQGQENVTWFDNFMAGVERNSEQYLILKEAGVAMGHQISDSDYELIDSRLEAANYSLYGNGVTENDLRQALELQAYAAGVYRDTYESFTFTDEEIEDFIAVNGSSYVTCGLMGFSLDYVEDEDDDEENDEENGDELDDEDNDDTDISKNKAAELARKLRSCKTAEAFGNKVVEILTEYKGYSDEDAEYVVSGISNDNFGYMTGNELGDWAFGGEAKAGDTLLVEGDGAFYVYLMTREPERDNSPTIDVRHILFSISDHLDAENPDEPTDEERAAALEECRSLAQEALNDWKNGAATEESFGELASELTDDSGSKSTGGLYETVSEGEMVQPFNDWCFDESRKPGDTDLVETTYGVHVMYFVGTSDPLWKADAINSMRAEKYEAWYAEQENLYTVTINDEIFFGIDG